MANIIYGDENYAIISEIALCSGVDRSVSVQNGSSQLSYTEAIAVQVSDFVSCFHPMSFLNTSFTLGLDIGAVEPLVVA